MKSIIKSKWVKIALLIIIFIAIYIGYFADEKWRDKEYVSYRISIMNLPTEPSIIIKHDGRIIKKGYLYDSEIQRKNLNSELLKLNSADIVSVEIAPENSIMFSFIPSGKFNHMYISYSVDHERDWLRNQLIINNREPSYSMKITTPYLISKFELTQKQWEKIMKYNDSEF